MRPPTKFNAIVLAVLLVLAWIVPTPMAWVFGVYAAATAFLRYQTWQAEWIILTSKRVIRVQGIPETTKTEASLRIDRVSGMRLVETVPGKVLGYGSIELEAPGDHPSVRRLVKIADPHEFFLALRLVVFGESTRFDPDDDPREYVTDPLPPVSDRDRFGRRRT